MQATRAIQTIVEISSEGKYAELFLEDTRKRSELAINLVSTLMSREGEETRSVGGYTMKILLEHKEFAITLKKHVDVVVEAVLKSTSNPVVGFSFANLIVAMMTKMPEKTKAALVSDKFYTETMRFCASSLRNCESKTGCLLASQGDVLIWHLSKSSSEFAIKLTQLYGDDLASNMVAAFNSAHNTEVTRGNISLGILALASRGQGFVEKLTESEEKRRLLMSSLMLQLKTTNNNMTQNNILLVIKTFCSVNEFKRVLMRENREVLADYLVGCEKTTKASVNMIAELGKEGSFEMAIEEARARARMFSKRKIETM